MLGEGAALGDMVVLPQLGPSSSLEQSRVGANPVGVAGLLGALVTGELPAGASAAPRAALGVCCVVKVLKPWRCWLLLGNDTGAGVEGVLAAVGAMTGAGSPAGAGAGTAAGSGSGARAAACGRGAGVSRGVLMP